mgnify:CR=1 FL=1
MSKIYVPELEDNNCVIIRSVDVIRVYDREPTLNSEIHYRDYYPNLNYNYNEGTQTFGNYSSSLPVCREASSDIKYNSSYPQFILVCVVILIFAVKVIYDFLTELFN